MFKVNRYTIKFKRRWHLQENLPAEEIKFWKKHGDGRYDTICEIYVEDLEVPRFTGIARLHPNDCPNKIEGKKIALCNAIGIYRPEKDRIVYNCTEFYNKKFRTEIWKAFWKWAKS